MSLSCGSMNFGSDYGLPSCCHTGRETRGPSKCLWETNKVSDRVTGSRLDSARAPPAGLVDEEEPTVPSVPTSGMLSASASHGAAAASAHLKVSRKQGFR